MENLVEQNEKKGKFAFRIWLNIESNYFRTIRKAEDKVVRLLELPNQKSRIIEIVQLHGSVDKMDDDEIEDQVELGFVKDRIRYLTNVSIEDVMVALSKVKAGAKPWLHVTSDDFAAMRIASAIIADESDPLEREPLFTTTPSLDAHLHMSHIGVGPTEFIVDGHYGKIGITVVSTSPTVFKFSRLAVEIHKEDYRLQLLGEHSRLVTIAGPALGHEMTVMDSLHPAWSSACPVITTASIPLLRMAINDLLSSGMEVIAGLPARIIRETSEMVGKMPIPRGELRLYIGDKTYLYFQRTTNGERRELVLSFPYSTQILIAAMLISKSM